MLTKIKADTVTAVKQVTVESGGIQELSPKTYTVSIGIPLLKVETANGSSTLFSTDTIEVDVVVNGSKKPETHTLSGVLISELALAGTPNPRKAIVTIGQQTRPSQSTGRGDGALRLILKGLE